MDPNAGRAVDVRELSTDELGAIIRNDTETYPLAGVVEVPRAIAELDRRAAVIAFAEGDTDGIRRTTEARALLADLEAERRAAKLADVDADLEGLEQAAGPGEADNAAHPHNDRILAANGFSLVREKCMTAAGAVPPLPAVEAAARFLKASRAQALAKGAGRDVIDGLDAELAQFDAVHKFGRALAAISERFEARARIAPGNGAGA